MDKKDKKLANLEEKLSPREKAALVWSLQCKGEWDRAERLEKSVPMGLFRIRDLDYMDRSLRLDILAFAWGFMHWQQIAIYERMSFWLLRLTKSKEHAEVIEGLMKGLERTEGKLLALDMALDEVCTANGIDAQAARRLVDVEGPYKPVWASAPDPEFLAQVRSVLSRLAA